MATLDDILSKLNPKTQKKVQFASELEVERQELPSIGLTRALSGGLRYGAQHMLWGPPSGGKSLIGLQTLAMAQKAGKTCALVDVEGAYTKEWGERLGIDNSNLILIADQRTFAGVTNTVSELIEAGIDFVLIDSISALIPGSYLEKTGDLKPFEDTNQIGQFAKEAGKMCGTFNLINDHTLILLISQVTTGIYNWGAQAEPMGGKKVMHMNTTSVKLASSMTDANQIKGEVTVGDRIFTKAIGRPVTWQITKDRGPGMHESGEYKLYYDGPMIGVDNIGELVDLAVQYGLIEQGGAWFTVNDQKFQGKPKVEAYLRENQDVADTMYKEIIG